MKKIEYNKGRRYEFFLATLGNKKRFAIIRLLLQKGPLTVTQIHSKLGYDQTTASHHLRRLAQCQYVFAKPNGKERIYRLNEKTIKPMLELIEKHVGEFCPCCEGE